MRFRRESEMKKDALSHGIDFLVDSLSAIARASVKDFFGLEQKNRSSPEELKVKSKKRFREVTREAIKNLFDENTEKAKKNRKRKGGVSCPTY